MEQLSLKRTLALIFTAIFASLSLFFGALFMSLPTASADELELTHEWEEEVTLNNSNFASTSSAAVPTPENWTAGAINNMPAPKSGVVDIVGYSSLSASEKTNYGFDESVLPLNTVSGATDDKILFINSKNIATSYGYTSEEMSWAVCSYYRVSVYVKTVNVSNGRGASVTLKGLTDEEDTVYGITGIDTDGQWIKYTIFAKTTAVKVSNVSINLALGANMDNAESSGVAFFDSVSVTALSSYKFYQATSSVDTNTVKTISIEDGETYFPGGKFDGNIADFGTVSGGYAQTLDATNGGNIYGVSGVRPAIENETTNYVLALTPGYNSGDASYDGGFVSIKSKDFTVKRFERIRVSGWFYSPNSIGTDGINIVFNYKSTLAGASDDYTASERKTLNANTNNAHNGWTQFIAYICGSERCDFTANLELSLGSESNDDASGVVFFDNISFKSVSPKDFTLYNTNASANATFDADANTENFTNGWMTTVADYDSLDEVTAGAPATPYGWTFNATDTVSSDGYSKVKVDTQNAKSGIVSIDGKTTVLATKYPQFAGINFGNALLLSSTTPTAYCYESANHTIEADKYAILTVSLATEDISGYGANIVLKKGTTVVATIEKITENGDYNFYIKNGSASSTFTVELWLGLNDYANNDTKLASGSVYFTRVKFNTESTAEVFNPIYASYNANRINEYGVRNVAVSLANEDFMSFNSYDTSSLKRPYNWSMTKGDGAVAYGVFDTQDNAVYDIVPSYYDNGGERFAFVVKNLTKTYSVVTLNNNFALTTGSYYKLTFSAKVDIPQEYIDSTTAKGAFISIGNGYTFEFKQTLDEHNNPTFKTYTFLIKAPDADSTTTISIGLGGKDKLNQQIEGALYINNMTFESLDSSEYIDLTSSLASGVNLIDAYTMRAPLSDTPPATDEDHTHTTAPIGSSAGDWWIIPSILLAIAILIAVIGYIVRRFIERHPKKKDDTPSRASYDRRNLTDNTSATPDTKDNFDKFDEDDDDGATEVPVTEVPAQEDAEETASESEQTEDAVSEEPAVEEPAVEEPTVEETASENEVSETTENIGGEPTENAPSLETNDDEE